MCTSENPVNLAMTPAVQVQFMLQTMVGDRRVISIVIVGENNQAVTSTVN
jgi:VCBS repeat-containing protein